MNYQLLQRYRIDRSDGAAAVGPERLVILVLKGHDTPEAAYVISKVDAMMISAALAQAATEIQAAGGGS